MPIKKMSSVIIVRNSSLIALYQSIYFGCTMNQKAIGKLSKNDEVQDNKNKSKS